MCSLDGWRSCEVSSCEWSTRRRYVVVRMKIERCSCQRCLVDMYRIGRGLGGMVGGEFGMRVDHELIGIAFAAFWFSGCCSVALALFI